jgi:hypothetical protein
MAEPAHRPSIEAAVIARASNLLVAAAEFAVFVRMRRAANQLVVRAFAAACARDVFANGSATIRLDPLSVYAPTAGLVDSTGDATKLRLPSDAQRTYAEGITLAPTAPTKLLNETLRFATFAGTASVPPRSRVRKVDRKHRKRRGPRTGVRAGDTHPYSSSY